MSNRRFEMYEYLMIISQLRQGASVRGLARSQVADRKKLRKVRDVALTQGWLDANKEMPSEEELSLFFKKSRSDSSAYLVPHQEKIEQWTKQGVQASTIYSHLQREHGFKGSYSVVQRHIKVFKDQQKPVTTILEFSPGESAQVDFGQGPKLINSGTGEEQKTWIFVMVLSWSRHMYAEIVLHQDVRTWLACHRRAFRMV